MKQIKIVLPEKYIQLVDKEKRKLGVTRSTWFVLMLDRLFRK